MNFGDHFALGLALQGLLFEPQDLVHLGVNSLSLMVPLIAVHAAFGRRFFAGSGIETRWASALRFDAAYYAGVVAMVGFWLALGQEPTPLQSWATFAASYLPLIAVAIVARGIMPNLADTDEVVPRMAFWATRGLPGGTLVAGLVLAAPFGAVMATVSSYLVVITSGIVRDIYQRFVHHAANEMQIRRLTYAVVLVVTCVAVAFSIRPVAYLQALIIFATSCGAASFVVPVMMACYWRRASSASRRTGCGSRCSRSPTRPRRRPSCPPTAARTTP